jgi:hypothetical protein
MGALSRGWTLTKQSWAVLGSDRSLVIFPILATIFAVLAAGAIWLAAGIVTVALNGGIDNSGIDNDNSPAYLIASVATIYVSTFIAIFFNVALAACAVRSLRGEDTKVSEGMAAAFGRIGPILGWTLVAGTIGLVLRVLEDRAPLVARIAVWFVGAAWAVATFFVIPVIALEGLGPWRSLKHSVEVVKSRWGEGATGAAAITVITALIILPLGVIGCVGAYLLFSAGQVPLAILVGAVGVAAVMVVSIISSALNQIFRVAVYQYAATGQAPAGFDSQLVATAFGGRAHRG